MSLTGVDLDMPSSTSEASNLRTFAPTVALPYIQDETTAVRSHTYCERLKLPTECWQPHPLVDKARAPNGGQRRHAQQELHVIQQVPGICRAMIQRRPKNWKMTIAQHQSL